MLTDTNGMALSGQYFPGSNIVGALPPSTVPANVLTIANTNTRVLWTNTANGAYTLLGTNAHIRFVDEYQTTNDFTTNGILIGGTNNNSLNYSNATGTLRISGPVYSGGQLLAPSNTFAPLLPILGTNNGSGASVWSFNVGGSRNAMNSNVAHQNILNLGGENNFFAGVCIDSIIMGGASNRFDNSSQSIIAGGIANWIPGAQSSAIIGGATNSLLGADSVILGGYNNHCYPGNSVVLGGTNNNNSSSAGKTGDIFGGTGATSGFNWSIVWNGVPGLTFQGTADSQIILNPTNGLAIGTNNAGTNFITSSGYNMLEVFGNADAQGFSIQGTNIVNVISNLLYGSPIPPLVTASNWLQANINSNITANIATSNNLATAIQSETTARGSAILLTSNYFQGQITPTKAFRATLPATYASIGIGFSTPLMPDGNYSVELTPADQNTATAAAWGMQWWITSKNNNGFTIQVPWATNAFDLNFECIVKENTQ